jgi:hypothetical protein
LPWRKARGPITSSTSNRTPPEKNALKPWLKEQWCIPPEVDAEFVCAMEDVLEVYHRPYDPQRPLVCLDEANKQLIGETPLPVPPEPGRPERFDYEYVRNGTANLFMISEPLLGWRTVQVTQRRTAKDLTEVLRWLVEELHADAEPIKGQATFGNIVTAVYRVAAGVLRAILPPRDAAHELAPPGNRGGWPVAPPPARWVEEGLWGTTPARRSSRNGLFTKGLGVPNSYCRTAVT